MTTRPKPPAETLLIRLAWLSIYEPGNRELPPLPRFDSVHLECLMIEPDPHGGKHLHFLVAAATELTYFPRVTAEGRVAVPTRERERLEIALQLLANLLVVSERKSCGINSPPHRSAYFQPQSDRAREWFDGFTDVHEDTMTGRMAEPWLPIDLTTLDHTELQDRMDGLALIADAISSGHPTGAFRDYIRVFESAFGLAPEYLTDPVLATLDARLGYTRDEVNAWFRARNPASHADRSRNFSVASDVVPFIDRIRQAAYDVFLNKKAWRSDSTDRREFYTLQVGIRSIDTKFIPQGATLYVAAQVRDEFGVFPINPFLKIGGPEGWWPKRPTEPTAKAFRTTKSLYVGDPADPEEDEDEQES